MGWLTFIAAVLQDERFSQCFLITNSGGGEFLSLLGRPTSSHLHTLQGTSPWHPDVQALQVL